VFEHAQNTRVAAAAIRAAARLSADNPTLAALLRKREDLTAALTRNQSRLVDLLSLPTGSDALQVSAIHSEIEGQNEQLAALDRQVAAAVPAYARMVRPGSINLGELQAVLDADEALIDTLSLPHATYVLALNRERAQLWKVDLSQTELAARVREIRTSLEAPRDSNAAGRTGPSPFPVGLAYALYHMLLGPGEPLFGSAHHLIIVPDGPFTALPFGLLVTRPAPAPERNAEYRSIPWLEIKSAISIAPGAASVVAFRRMRVLDSLRLNLLGVGNPVLPSVRPQASLADLYGSDVRPSLRGLAPLPETADELRAIAESMGGRATLLLGPDATRLDVQHAVKADAYRVVAFATHGIVGTSSSEPGLVLSVPKDQPGGDPDLLTSGDIASLPLDSDLVILSACDTASGDGSPDGEALAGLARAFLGAGARALLVSHWRVDSEAAASLTTKTIEEWPQPDRISGFADAHWAAVVAMLNHGTDRLAHPYYWGAFAVITGGR
jgi:CHAT domain-containing protein